MTDSDPPGTTDHCQVVNPEGSATVVLTPRGDRHPTATPEKCTEVLFSYSAKHRVGAMLTCAPTSHFSKYELHTFLRRSHLATSLLLDKG